MKDTRKSSRVDAQLFISYDIMDESGQISYSGMALSRDLSRKGVLMEERTSFPENSKIQLHLALGQDVIDIDGQIRHVEEITENTYHIGVEFLEMSPDMIEKISKFYPQISK